MSKGYSIVIPNLNSPVVDQTVEAILGQMQGKDFEIVIVGKDDENLVKSHGRIRFFYTEKRKTPAEARNIGIEKARFDTLVFMDADCVPKPGYFEKLFWNNNEIVLGALEFEAGNFWVSCDNFIHFYPLAKTTARRELPLFGTMQLKVPKRVVQEAGSFNEKFVTGEDIDLAIRLKKKGYRFFFEPDATVNHYPNRESFASILRHSMHWANDSIKVRLKHKTLLKTPVFFGNRFVLLALSPFIAFYVTARIYKHLPNLRYLHFAPFAYLSKLFWCFGAFGGMQK